MSQFITGFDFFDFIFGGLAGNSISKGIGSGRGLRGGRTVKTQSDPAVPRLQARISGQRGEMPFNEISAPETHQLIRRRSRGDRSTGEGQVANLSVAGLGAERTESDT